MAELDRGSDTELCEPRDVLLREQLRVLDARAQAAPLLPRLLERVERVAIREVADRVHRDGESGACARADDLHELVAARDLHSRAVEQPGGLRAERPVHERLQVADADQVVAEAAVQAQSRGVLHLVGRDRLPDAQVQRALVAEPLPDAERAEPAVLVVNGRDPARHGDPHALPRGLDHLVLGRTDVAVAEVPGALLAQHAGRLALSVAHDDAAIDLQVAVRTRERGRVEPKGVVVAGHQGCRCVARDPVERLLRRLRRGRPVAAAPAGAAEPAAGLDVAQRLGDPLERLVQGRGVLEPDLPLGERPGREVDVGVGEAREDAPPGEVNALRARERGLVRPDAAGDAVAGDGECARDGEGRIHRPDDPVLEDHVLRNLSGPSFVLRTVNTLVILLLLIVMAALATYWPTSY